jgi:hypothetical protein
MKRNLFAATLIVAILWCAPTFAAIAIDTVPVGDPGNPNDPATGNLYGAVNYAYSIGNYELSVGRYGVSQRGRRDRVQIAVINFSFAPLSPAGAEK